MTTPPKQVDVKYIPVQMFVRIARREGEPNERALLVARREDGQEYVFTYEKEDSQGEYPSDLTVCNFETGINKE